MCWLVCFPQVVLGWIRSHMTFDLGVFKTEHYWLLFSANNTVLGFCVFVCLSVTPLYN